MDGIKLFGMNISTCHKCTKITDGSHDMEASRTNTEHSQEDQLTQYNQEGEGESSLKGTAESDGNAKIAISEDTYTAKNETEGDATNLQYESLKKPDKLLPCPRCNSMDTKFCYYNNYNVKQPRHFCKSCQRYWTAGGSMRNMPVGAGRRKHKNPTSQIDVANGLISVPSGFVSLGFDLQNVGTAVSCRDGDDCSSGSTVTTCNSVTEHTQDGNGFYPHIPGVSWSWNSTIPIPTGCSTMPILPIYPSPYWNYIPWLPLTQIENLTILGKHSRDGDPNGCEEPKKQKKNSVLTPKTLRIDDPDEAARSSILSTLGINNENISTRGMFKAFHSKGEENLVSNTSPVLQANPAALSRSLCFLERA